MRAGFLGGGTEFRRIESLIESIDAPASGNVTLGPGDDAAALLPDAGESVVVSSDLFVEDIHFRREWLTWGAVGYRSVAAALSDIAAMAARPIGVQVGIALPPELDSSVLQAIGRGMGECLRTHGTALLGGDLSASPGPVVIDVTALGASTAPVGRSGAVPGDTLWLTGELGAAAAAAAAWADGLEPHPEARRRFEAPLPRLAEGLWLAEHAGIHAMIDLSDGLAGDATHLAAASVAGLEVDVHAVPLHPVLEAWANRDAALSLAVGGGEDYELLLAAAPGAIEGVLDAARSELGVRLTAVGRVTAGRGVAWVGPDGKTRDPPGRGFDHFETEA